MKMVAKIGGRKAGEGNGKKKYGCGCEVEKGRWKKKINSHYGEKRIHLKWEENSPIEGIAFQGGALCRSRFFHRHVYEVNFIVHTILDMLGLKQ